MRWVKNSLLEMKFSYKENILFRNHESSLTESPQIMKPRTFEKKRKKFVINILICLCFIFFLFITKKYKITRKITVSNKRRTLKHGMHESIRGSYARKSMTADLKHINKKEKLKAKIYTFSIICTR